MQPLAGTVPFQCKEPSPWALTLPSLMSHLPVSANEVQSWPPQNCLFHPLLVQFSPKLLHSYPNAPSTHTYGQHSLHTPMCLIYPHPYYSEFLQASTALLLFLLNTSQGGLKHSKLPGLQVPTSITSILKSLRYITYSRGGVFHLKALPILTQGKNMLGPARSSGPRGST